MVAIGGALALASAAVALWRFEWFLLALLGCRPLLDGLTLGAEQRAFNASAALGLVFIAASVLWLVDQHHRGPWVPPSAATVAVFLLVCAAFLSVPVSALPGASAAAAVRLLSAALMLAVLEQLLVGRPDRVRRVLTAVAVCTGFVLAWAAWQLTTGRGVDPYSGLLRAQGPFVHSNVLGKFLVVVLLGLVGVLPLLQGRRRAAAIAALLPIALVLCLTYARNAWVAAGVGALYLLGRSRPRLVPLAIAALVGLVATVPVLRSRVTDLWAPPVIEGVPGSSLSWRVGYWLDLLPLWRRSPLNGTGLETIPDLGGTGLQAHNVWVQALVETGLVGVVALAVCVGALAATLRQRLRRSVTRAERVLSHTAIAVGLALLVMSVSENLLSETTTLWYAAVVMTFGHTPAARRWAPTPEPPLQPVRRGAHAAAVTTSSRRASGDRAGVRARGRGAPPSGRAGEDRLLTVVRRDGPPARGVTRRGS